MAFSFTQATSKLDKLAMQVLTSTGISVPVHKLGYTVTSTDGRKYRYVRFDSSGLAAVAGAPCVVAASEDPNVITADVSDGGSVAIGCFLSVLTDTYYGWVQIEGRAVDCPCTDGANAEVAMGDPLYGADDATTALWTKATIGTHHVKAIARMAGSGGYATIQLLP